MGWKRIKAWLAIEFNSKFDMRKVRGMCNYQFKKNLCQVNKLLHKAAQCSFIKVLLIFAFFYVLFGKLTLRKNWTEVKMALSSDHLSKNCIFLIWLDAMALFKRLNSRIIITEPGHIHEINTNKNNDSVIVLIAAIIMCIILSAMWR